jgi:hypothetical protein
MKDSKRPIDDELLGLCFHWTITSYPGDTADDQLLKKCFWLEDSGRAVRTY